MLQKLTAIGMVALLALGVLLVPASSAVLAEEGAPDLGEPAGPEGPPAAAQARMEAISSVLGGDGVVEELLEDGYTPRDLMVLAGLMECTGEDLDTLLTLKEDLGTWAEVAEELGVTRQDMAEAFKEIFPDGWKKRHGKRAHRRAVRVRVGRLYDGDRETIEGLHEEGFKPGEMAIIGVLYTLSGTPAEAVAAMKTNENTWDDVAAELGVNMDAFHKFTRIVLGP
jgi:hypothetical protein